MKTFIVTIWLTVLIGLIAGVENTEPVNAIDVQQVSFSREPRTTCSLNGSRYYIQFFFKANWFRAAQFCRYNGMQLASINSLHDQLTIEQEITALGLQKERFWLSGNDLLNKGHFSWASTGRPMNFTRWWTGQPDNTGGVEDCVELWEFLWNDNRCGVEFFFVCEE